MYIRPFYAIKRGIMDKKQVSKKIKKALAERRKAGVLLGAHNPRVQAGLRKWRQKKAKEPKPLKLTKTQQADIKVLQPFQTLLNAKYSYKSIAYIFNLARTPTRQGKRWSAVQVFRVVKRNKLKRQVLSTRQKDIALLTQDQLIKIVMRNKPKRAKKG